MKKKNRKKKHDLKWLNKETIQFYLKYNQYDAAEILNVSTSTLKRHFYSLNLNYRWPCCRRQEKKLQNSNISKFDIRFIINYNITDEKFIDNKTLETLRRLNNIKKFNN